VTDWGHLGFLLLKRLVVKTF